MFNTNKTSDRFYYTLNILHNQNQHKAYMNTATVVHSIHVINPPI